MGGAKIVNSTIPPDRNASTERTPRQLARWVLVVFVLTFIASRIVVLLIMTQTIPDLFLHVGGTHIHHLNYGIFLLSGVGAYLIFAKPGGRKLTAAATFYAIGLGLTFDEFGMWLHLGGGYWQRASYDAVVLIAALLGAFVAAPSIKRFRPRHWATTVLLLVAVVIFVLMMVRTWRYASRKIEPKLEQLDDRMPP